MIRDQRLRLASNLSIGTASRQFVGVQSSDLLSASTLREFGRGEQLFCCVTVTQTFSDHGTVDIGDISTGIVGAGLIKISLKQEAAYSLAAISALGPGLDIAAYAFHQKNPTLGTTGWILSNFSYTTIAPDPVGFNATARNFVAGKKFCFAVSPVTHNSKYQKSAVLALSGNDFTATYVSEYNCTGGAYLLVEEVSSEDQDFVGANITTTGNIDADIVMVAEAGAGPTFNDVRHYPTRTIVQ